jgi:hypothetical protein
MAGFSISMVAGFSLDKNTFISRVDLFDYYYGMRATI